VTVQVLWREGDWRCEYHPRLAGTAWLQVYHGDVLATAETTPSGTAAHQRATVLRHRVLRGDLSANPSTSPRD
jgi:hypothetical protein